jgi:hypothetical protein
MSRFLEAAKKRSEKVNAAIAAQMKPLEPIEDTRRDSQPNQSGTPSGPQCIVRISMPYHAHLQSTKLFLYNIIYWTSFVKSTYVKLDPDQVRDVI